MLTHATPQQPLLICLDSVDQLVGSTEGSKMSWLPTKLPPNCKIIGKIKDKYLIPQDSDFKVLSLLPSLYYALIDK